MVLSDLHKTMSYFEQYEEERETSLGKYWLYLAANYAQGRLILIEREMYSGDFSRETAWSVSQLRWN